MRSCPDTNIDPIKSLPWTVEATKAQILMTKVVLLSSLPHNNVKHNSRVTIQTFLGEITSFLLQLLCLTYYKSLFVNFESHCL